MNSSAQAGSPGRQAQHSLEVRGGYTGGRFTHYTDDFASSFNLFGGGRSQTGQLVAHHFNGMLLGASFVSETGQTGSAQKITLLAGLDVLAAADRLTFADGRRMTLPLTAAHPHAAVEISDTNWLVRAEAGLLLGRVGYYASTSTGDILSTRIVVDTVQVVTSFKLRTGWANWVLAEGGYGAGGLLGLANPAWQLGLGTGFGRRSPVTLLAGITGAESTEYGRGEEDHFFLQLEAGPASHRWRATGFFTFGGGTYSRVAAQMAYLLPLRTASK